MRTQVDYGDNFPVPFESWNPTVPWRFPQYQVSLKKTPFLSRIFPWLMLGVGLAAGIGWMSGRVSRNPSSGAAGFMESQKPGQELNTSSPARSHLLKRNPHSAFKIKSRMA